MARDYGSHWAQYSHQGHPLTNLFTGEPIRFEASPGNFVLRPSPAGEGKDSNAAAYDLVWHDLDGAEAETNTIPERRW